MFDSFVGEVRIAGTQDLEWCSVDPKFVFEGLGQIDFGQDAKPLLGERGANSGIGLIEGQGNGGVK